MYKESYIFSIYADNSFEDHVYSYTPDNPLIVYFVYEVSIAVTDEYPTKITYGAAQESSFSIGQYG